MTKATPWQGYTRPQSGECDHELTSVGKGTACGEYMRRFWQPITVSSEVGDLPSVVRILGEDLVLFRDGSGALGLVHRHCSHRGASLEFGIIAEHGLICAYHGWHYGVDGRLIRAGSEPVNSPICSRVVHGAYPVEEVDGIVFAYLGPIEQKPPLPRFDTQQIPDTERIPFIVTTPCNWLQVYENTQDPIHVIHLHARSSGVQFGKASGVDQVIEYRDTPLGMINVQTRRIDDHLWTRTTESILPNCNQTGAIWEEAETSKLFQRVSMLRWMVPVDDTCTRTIGWRYFRHDLDPRNQGDADQIGVERIDFYGQTESERGYEQRQRQPGDFEVQVSQRPIAVHQLENLASSDAGVVHLRSLIRKNLRKLSNQTLENRYPQRDNGEVSTFTQDTVWHYPDAAQNDDKATHDALLKSFGKAVSDNILSSAGQGHDARIESMRVMCEKDFNANQ